MCQIQFCHQKKMSRGGMYQDWQMNSGERLMKRDIIFRLKRKSVRRQKKDSIAALKLVQDIYAEADKGDASNVVLTDSVMEQMKKILGRGGVPVISSEEYSVMENYQVMEKLLTQFRSRELKEM